MGMARSLISANGLLRRGAIAGLVTFHLTACAKVELPSAGFVDLAQKTGVIELTGWMRWQSEVMLYADRAMLEKSISRKRPTYDDAIRFPHCISGVFPSGINMGLYRKFDKRKVAVRGSLVDFSSLPKNADPLLIHGTTLDGQIIRNQCWGSKVLLLESLHPAN